MPSRTPTPCTHEQRPGTTVCLYCRQEERAAALARVKRVLLLVALAGATVVGAVVWQLRARGESDAPPPAPDRRVASVVTPASDSARPVAATSNPLAPTAAAAATPRPTAAAPAPRPARFAPVIAEGTTELGGGMVAVRTGDTVAVRFDHPMTRTRRADKFEQIVRSTVAGIYGAGADSLVKALPEGAVARAGDLVNDLPTRGVQLALAAGDTLTVWPTIRRGRDGLLVVAYRAVVH